MIQTLFSLGAFHVQFNCISSETLRDAQKHPENYKDLLVRVAGYSTQFVNLSKSMQDAHHRPYRAYGLLIAVNRTQNTAVGGLVPAHGLYIR